MMISWDVITVGDVFVDIVLSDISSWPRAGEEVFAARLHREIGGGAAITACGLANLGLRVSILAAVGETDGKWMIDGLQSRRVDVSHIHFEQNEATALTVSVSTAEDRAFFTYPGANRALPELLADPQAQVQLALARHVHLACPIEPDLLAALARRMRAEGKTVSFDVGWQTAWLKDDRSLRALREVDLFMPNESEARLMTGRTEPEAILRAFAGAGLRGVALKLGAEGAASLWEGEIIRAEPYQVSPEDTTGAGDCFDAGFIYAWLGGESPARRLQIANLCGALSTRKMGGITAFPTPDELASLLDSKI